MLTHLCAPQKISSRRPPDEVKAFFSENGYSTDVAQKAWEYYRDGDWKDGQGKQVRNWKQKMRGVWFKDEAKMPGQRSAGSRKVIMMDPSNAREDTWSEAEYEAKKHITGYVFIRYED